MMTLHRTVMVLGLVLLMTGTSATGWAKTQLVPKVDNFIFLYDASGSMRMKYMATKARKANLAKEAMTTLNAAIPELGYQSGLFTATPAFQINQDMQTYTRNGYGQAIEGLTVPSKVFGVQTPLAKGMMQLEQVLSRADGSTAVILFSDGGENRGGSPVVVAQDLYGRHDICFHLINYAQSKEEKEVLDRIAALDECSVVMSGEEMKSEAAAQRFAQQVFYSQVTVAEAVADEDGDGVPDHLDQCPGTPRNLVVDETGCPIEARRRLQVQFDFDQATIKPNDYPVLERVAEILMDNPEALLTVEGHTDSIGDADYNMELSSRRAASVEGYLVENYGIDPARIETVGYGEERPIADNSTKEGRRENRRAMGVISKYERK